MNLANKLTLLRVVLIPVFVLVTYILDPTYMRFVATGIFLVASVTDWLDGYIARKYHMITNFGKFMDPLADKLLVAAALVYLVEAGLVSGWVVIIILSREFIVSGIRLVASDNGVVIAASIYGKIKTAFTMVMIIVVMLELKLIGIEVIEWLLIYGSAFLTVLSGVEMVLKNRKAFFSEKGPVNR